MARVRVQVPATESAGTFHVVVQVSDKGSPALARYQRVILNVSSR